MNWLKITLASLGCSALLALPAEAQVRNYGQRAPGRPLRNLAERAIERQDDIRAAVDNTIDRYANGNNNTQNSGHASLGVTLADVQGTQVRSITPGSPAERAGIQVNDEILSVNNQDVNNHDQLVQELQQAGNGNVTIWVSRNGRERELTASLAMPTTTRARGNAYYRGPSTQTRVRDYDNDRYSYDPADDDGNHNNVGRDPVRSTQRPGRPDTFDRDYNQATDSKLNTTRDNVERRLDRTRDAADRAATRVTDRADNRARNIENRSATRAEATTNRARRLANETQDRRNDRGDRVSDRASNRADRASYQSERAIDRATDRAVDRTNRTYDNTRTRTDDTRARAENRADNAIDRASNAVNRSFDRARSRTNNALDRAENAVDRNVDRSNNDADRDND